MLKQPLLALTVLSACAGPASGQVAGASYEIHNVASDSIVVVAGTVVDAATNTPLENGLILAWSRPQEKGDDWRPPYTSTDAAGRFRLELPAGRSFAIEAHQGQFFRILGVGPFPLVAGDSVAVVFRLPQQTWVDY